MYVNLCRKFITMWCGLNIVMMLPSRASVCCFEAVPCLWVVVCVAAVWTYSFEMPCCREADEKLCGTKGGSRVEQVARIPSKKKIWEALTSCASHKVCRGSFSHLSASLDSKKWHFASSLMAGSPAKTLLASLLWWKPWPWLELRSAHTCLFTFDSKVAQRAGLGAGRATEKR